MSQQSVVYGVTSHSSPALRQGVTMKTSEDRSGSVGPEPSPEDCPFSAVSVH